MGRIARAPMKRSAEQFENKSKHLNKEQLKQNPHLRLPPPLGHRHPRTSPQIFGIIPKNPKNSWMKFFIEKFWDFLGWIPKDPKRSQFFGVISNESQKNWDHPKKIGVILGWFGEEIHEGPKQSHGSKKKHLYTSP